MLPQSAGVYLSESDRSDYQLSTGTVTITAVVGGASKGLLNTPTILKSEGELDDKFGPSLSNDNAVRSARRILRKGGWVMFVRVANAATVARLTVQSVSGAVIGVAATGSISLTGQPTDGNNIVISDGVTPVTFEFDDGGGVTGGAIAVLIGADAAATAAALAAAINAHAFNVTATYVALATTMTLANTATGVAGNVAITKTGANITVTGMAGGVTAVAGSATPAVHLDATSPGTWASGLKVIISNTSAIGASVDAFDIQIQAVIDSVGSIGTVERYTNVSLNPAHARYLVTALNEGIVGVGSKSLYFTATAVANLKPTNGTFAITTPGTDGVSGLTPADYIGTVNGVTATGLKTLRNPEAIDIDTLIVPGVSHAGVIDEMFNVAAKHDGVEAIPDAPRGLTPAEVVDWHNGMSAIPDAPSSPLNTSLGCMFYGWGRVYDATLKSKVWVPPSAFAAGQFAEVDAKYGPQFAAAGETRGLLGEVELEYSPSEEDRDLLMGGTNQINPFVNFAGVGACIYGNATLQRNPTALDQISVRRMLNRAKKLVKKATRGFVFDPNDATTWDKLTMRVNPILANLRDNRGLAAFRVRCDASTNTPEIRAQKRLLAVLVVEAVDTAETVEINFTVAGAGQGAQFGL